MGPLLEGDAMVVVRIAGVEEGGDAVLQCEKRGADGEEFVARHHSVGH